MQNLQCLKTNTTYEKVTYFDNRRVVKILKIKATTNAVLFAYKVYIERV